MAYFNVQPLLEDVFVSSIKGNKANLSYRHRQSLKPTKNFGNLSSIDMIDTSRMDQNNHDTFIVPLKGGIKSYNITSIRGEDVMHYFKNKFANKKTEISLKTGEKTSTYQLMMQDSEFLDFLHMFIQKVSNVINYAVQNMQHVDNNDELSIVILPIPSSSNFNVEMAKILSRNGGISNYQVSMTSTQIFQKDLSNLQKDEEFIKKNKDFYNSRHFLGSDNNMSSEDVIDDTLRRLNNISGAQSQELVDNYNMCIRKVLTSYYQHVSAKTIAKRYDMLVKARDAIRSKLGRSWWYSAFNKIKYAKGPSIERRTQEIWDIVASVYGKSYITRNPIEIVEISKRDFQIKKLSNDTRLGMKNYFQPTANAQDEITKIKDSVIVIFDDNISGGATLSDICMQASRLGLKNLIPITFGVMHQKNTQNRLPINVPSQWNY